MHQVEGALCVLQVVPIVNANSIIAEGLYAMWASKTPEEARAVLEKDDVTVTNQGDKVTQLAKLAMLDEEAREVMAAAEAGVSASGAGGRSVRFVSAEEVSPPSGGSGVELAGLRAAAKSSRV